MKEKLCLLFWTQEVQNLQLTRQGKTSEHPQDISTELRMPSNEDNIRCETKCSYPAEEHVDGREVTHLSHDRERAEVLHEPVLSAVLWIYTAYNNNNIQSDYSKLSKTLTELKNDQC